MQSLRNWMGWRLISWGSRLNPEALSDIIRTANKIADEAVMTLKNELTQINEIAKELRSGIVDETAGTNCQTHIPLQNGPYTKEKCEQALASAQLAQSTSKPEEKKFYESIINFWTIKLREFDSEQSTPVNPGMGETHHTRH